MEELTLTEFLAYIVRRGKLILLSALIFALLISCYKIFLSGDYALPFAPNDQPAYDNYLEQKAELEEQLIDATVARDLQIDYVENAPYMHLDPNNLYTSTLYLAITSSGNGSLTDYLFTQIQNGYMVHWECEDLSAALSLPDYENCKDPHLREVVSISIIEGGIFKITALGNSESEASARSNAAHEWLLSQQKTIIGLTSDHQLSPIGRKIDATPNQAVSNYQASKKGTLTEYESTISALSAQITALEQPALSASVVVKYCVLGGILGAALSCACLFMWHLFRNHMESSYQLERVAKIPFLGATIASRGVFSLIADKMLDERSWRDREQALAFACAKVKSCLAETRDVLLLSTLPAAAQDTGLQKLIELLSSDGYHAVCVADAQQNPQAIMALESCKKVILAESVGRTSMKKIPDLINSAAHTGKPIVGFLLF